MAHQRRITRSVLARGALFATAGADGGVIRSWFHEFADGAQIAFVSRSRRELAGRAHPAAACRSLVAKFAAGACGTKRRRRWAEGSSEAIVTLSRHGCCSELALRASLACTTRGAERAHSTIDAFRGTGRRCVPACRALSAHGRALNTETAHSTSDASRLSRNALLPSRASAALELAGAHLEPTSSASLAISLSRNVLVVANSALCARGSGRFMELTGRAIDARGAADIGKFAVDARGALRSSRGVRSKGAGNTVRARRGTAIAELAWNARVADRSRIAAEPATVAVLAFHSCGVDEGAGTACNAAGGTKRTSRPRVREVSGSVMASWANNALRCTIVGRVQSHVACRARRGTSTAVRTGLADSA